MRCLKRKLKNQWNFVCKLIAILLVSMLWTSLFLILWKSLSLGKLVLMSMIFLVPQARRRKFTLMILCLLYMMITMMIMLFSVHLLLSRKLITITICLLYLMIMVMRIIMIAILLNFLSRLLIRMTMFMWRVLILLCIMIRIFQVMVILWTLSMMLLKVIMREETWLYAYQ